MENTVPETQAAPAAPQKKGKLGLILGIAIPVVIIAIVAAVFVGIENNKKNLYKDAVELAEDGDIAEAVAIHEELGDYKDLKLQISDCAVDEFDDLLEKGSYKKVLRLYGTVVNYPDAIEEMDQMLREHVEKLMSNFEYSTAVDLYDRAVKEGVGVELVVQGIVDGALIWLDDCNFYDVIEVYDLLAEHENAVKTLEEAIGNKYKELLDAESYQADNLYYALENNEIHVDAVYAAIYERACTLMENGEYYDAKSIFETLGEYQDSAQKIQEIQLAIDTDNLNYYLENGWYSDAMSIINSYEGETHDQMVATYVTYCVDNLNHYIEKGWYGSALSFVEDHEGEIYDQLLAVYMTCCGDGTIIADLEAAVAARLELENQGSTDYQAKLDAELNILSKYEDMPFYDEDLGDLIDSYLDNLSDQQYYINWYSNYWYMPYYWGNEDAERIAILTTLGESYGFAASNAELQAILGTSESVSAYWTAWYNISDDLRWDLDYAHTDYSEGYRYLSFCNNTDYTFSLRLHVSYTDYDGAELSYEDAEYTALTPDAEFKFIMTFPENAAYWTATWEFYDIYLGETPVG